MSKQDVAQEALPPCPYAKANIFSKLFFWWLNALFGIGNRRTLEAGDLYRVLPDDASKGLGDTMEDLWKEELKRTNCHEEDATPDERLLASFQKKKRPSLRRVIWKQFGTRFMLVGLLAFFEEVLVRGLAQPMCLGLFVHYFSARTPGSSLSEGYGLAAALSLSVALLPVLLHPYFFGVVHAGMRIRVAASTLIFRKALRLNPSAVGGTTAGVLVNLLSNDVARFDQTTVFVHYLWIGPLQAGVSTYLLWSYYGFGAWATLAGMSLLALFVPFQGYMGSLFSRLRSATAERTDSRIRLLGEIFAGIKIIKMYAWEAPFSAFVEKARGDEVKFLRKTTYFRALNMSLFFTSSKLTVFLTFVTYVLRGGTLTAEMVFVALILHNNVRVLMTLFFPNAISFLAESLVSIRRIEDFMLLEEVKPRVKLPSEEEGVGVQMKDLSARWSSGHPGHGEDTLSSISLEVRPGELVALVGHVGSGKTSLLQTVLGELLPHDGTLRVEGTLAYTAQDPWVFAGSVRDNILFGKDWDPERYGRVVEVCALERDFLLLPHGDGTLVGDKGSSLSGGQRARIALARAVYADADIYLLDDPLSAVDAEVGKHIFESCILSFLKPKTVILVTHQTQLLASAPAGSLKEVVLLEGGRIKARSDTYDKIAGLVLASSSSHDGGGGVEAAKVSFLNIETSRTRTTSVGSGSGGYPIFILGERAVGSTFSIPEEVALEATTKKQEEEDEEVATQTLLLLPNGKEESPPPPPLNPPPPGLEDEGSAEGGIKFGLYITYFKAGSTRLSLTLLIVFNLITQVLFAGSDWWLKLWVSSEESKTKTGAWYESKSTQTWVYSSIIASLFIASLIRTVAFFLICMKASQVLHARLYSGLIHAPMAFYERTPLGRILNRVSKDVGCIDEVLPSTMFDALEIFLNTIGILVLVGVVNPILLSPVALLVILFYFLRRLYLRTARSVKRLETSAKSPVFSALSTSLAGLPTIRAFKMQGHFMKVWDSAQDAHSSSWFVFLSITRWFGIWTDWICVAFIIFVTYSLLWLGADGPGVGLAVSSVMGLTGMLQWGVRQSAEVESQMVSVERVVEYIKLPSEAPAETLEDEGLPDNWPARGEVVFEDVVMAYGGGGTTNTVLNHVTLEVRPGEKIGIVGRTGAGKSSLLSALFRIVELSSGRILIDGEDTSRLGLRILRSRLSIIPQDPVLFMGSLRENLDPFETYEDAALWSALEDVALASAVRDVGAGLGMEVAEGGSNLSVGQRQLICLARAILKNNRILIMDEATANVDHETDALIQATIRSKFGDATVLTVAHRLHTVMHCDKILVLDAGTIGEYGTPATLLNNPEGMLTKLARQSGAWDTLVTLAGGQNKDATKEEIKSD